MNARWTKRLIAPLACTLLAACGAPIDSTPDDQPATKSEVAAQLENGKADHMIDWCDRFDWYGDGICDDFCLNPDPDCDVADYDPCDGLSCGDSCTVCDPAAPDCFETAVVKMCQPDGSCAAAVASCGDDDGDDTNNGDGGDDAYDPCGGLSCGDTCTICDPNDTDCFETAVVKMCQTDGTCSATVAQCDGRDDDAYDPCEGKMCGDSCSLCDPNDPDCFETLELKVCNPQGVCVSETTSATCN